MTLKYFESICSACQLEADKNCVECRHNESGHFINCMKRKGSFTETFVDMDGQSNDALIRLRRLKVCCYIMLSLQITDYDVYCFHIGVFYVVFFTTIQFYTLFYAVVQVDGMTGTPNHKQFHSPQCQLGPPT